MKTELILLHQKRDVLAEKHATWFTIGTELRF
jgi:hypothetical protein